jgi:hypothetical protein
MRIIQYHVSYSVKAGLKLRAKRRVWHAGADKSYYQYQHDEH